MPLVLIFHPLCAIPLLTALVGSFAAVSISPPSPLHGLPSSRRRRTKTKERRRERAMRPTPSSSSASLAPAAPQQGLPSAAAAAWPLDGATASQHQLANRNGVLLAAVIFVAASPLPQRVLPAAVLRSLPVTVYGATGSPRSPGVGSARRTQAWRHRASKGRPGR